MGGWHDSDDDLSQSQRLRDVCCRGHSAGNDMTGKIRVVLAMLRNGLRDCRGMRPQSDRVAAALRERHGKSGAPCAATDDGNAAHAAAAFDLPKRYSVPVSRRRILAWCFAITMSGMMTQTASSQGVTFP